MAGLIPTALKCKEIIKCTPKGKYLGNQRCHANALSYALRNPKMVCSIIGVMQIFSDDLGCAHFVVKLNDGTYHDPTYGNLSGVLDSYCIPIEEYKVDSFNPSRELQNLKDYIYSLQPWYFNLFRGNPY